MTGTLKSPHTTTPCIYQRCISCCWNIAAPLLPILLQVFYGVQEGFATEASNCVQAVVDNADTNIGSWGAECRPKAPHLGFRVIDFHGGEGGLAVCASNHIQFPWKPRADCGLAALVFEVKGRCWGQCIQRSSDCKVENG